jgi:hypothetical protein
MRGIAAVGFDMDYTLAQARPRPARRAARRRTPLHRPQAPRARCPSAADIFPSPPQYKPETFEDLAYRQACGKLVSQLGYPPVVGTYEYDCHYMVRGLAVDKARGNVLKMDRHKYVKLAFHGFRELPRAERLATYADAAVRESYDEPDYALLDTLFSLGETYLFCQLVELKDAQPALLAHKSYAQMHADVRQAVDMCHRDGSLKRVVAADPGKYIYPDPALVPLLDMLRSSGRCAAEGGLVPVAKARCAGSAAHGRARCALAASQQDVSGDQQPVGLHARRHELSVRGPVRKRTQRMHAGGAAHPLAALRAASARTRTWTG